MIESTKSPKYSADSSQEMPPSRGRAAPTARNQRTAQSTTTRGKGKIVPRKRKHSPAEKAGTAKKAKLHPTESDDDGDAEDSRLEYRSPDPFILEGEDGFDGAHGASLREHRAAARRAALEAQEALAEAQEARPARRATQEESPTDPFIYPGDPGFDEAWEESNRARQRRRDQAAQAARGGTQEAGRALQPPPRPTPMDDTPSLGREAPRYSTPGSESLRVEGRTPSSQVPRQRISAMTGLPFAGRHRRPGALAPYGNLPIRHRSPAVGTTRVATPPGVGITQGNTAHPTATRTDITGRPYGPTIHPPGGVYAPTPEGRHYFYTDDSGVPSRVNDWGTSTNPTTFTHNQRRQVQERQAQTNLRPPPPSLAPPPPQPGQNPQSQSVSPPFPPPSSLPNQIKNPRLPH